jgi:hypothetical protein
MWFANPFWTVKLKYRLSVLIVSIKFTCFINWYKENIRNIRIVLHKANNDVLHENILFFLPILKFCYASIVTNSLSI